MALIPVVYNVERTVKDTKEEYRIVSVSKQQGAFGILF